MKIKVAVFEWNPARISRFADLELDQARQIVVRNAGRDFISTPDGKGGEIDIREVKYEVDLRAKW